MIKIDIWELFELLLRVLMGVGLFILIITSLLLVATIVFLSFKLGLTILGVL
jgi:hypothetical protein